MKRSFASLTAETLSRLGTRWLPFADAASAELPLGRLLRLALFQVSVGMALTLLVGTLNRVMIVELGVAAVVVSLMIALPLLFGPFRALIGFKSDVHRSAFGWRRVPYLWFGTLLQFGGFAILPFALLLLGGDHSSPAWIGTAGAGLGFLMIGAGAHTVQTAGLALATDLCKPEQRPRVVALLYLFLLVGMILGGTFYALVLRDFNPLRLIQVVQGAAVITVLLNVIALWKQEPRDRARAATPAPAVRFGEAWSDFMSGGRSARLLLAVGLGAAGFSMQEVLLEPFGGEVLGMGVAGTSFLTALTAGGAVVAFGLSARWLERGFDACRLAAMGTLIGVGAFVAILLSAVIGSPLALQLGAVLIGGGGGFFLVGTLTAAMDLHDSERNGLAMGAWGAVQATAMGLAVVVGGVIRDGAASMAASGTLGAGLSGPGVGYMIVFQIEIVALFSAMVVLGPLVVSRGRIPAGSKRSRFGLAELPG
ncbi:MAG: MFS transporter [Gemmatimonadales bacterium]|nr:MAG: MFS transporter [Gemmatimonadales bacterium]